MSTLVNFGGTWTSKDEERQWNSVSLSSTGLYQTAVDYSGKIYVSSDYGNTWTPKDENRNWYSVSISSTGQYQTAVIANGGQIYVSDDYGNTWTPKDENRNWYSVSISSTGQYQTALDNGGQLYVSTNFGNNWTAKDTNNLIRSWSSVSLSSSGQYQTAAEEQGSFYVSSDYGNTWTAKGSNKRWQAVSISSTGQYQTALEFLGRIFVSSDYGNTWTNKTYSDKTWWSVSMTSTGQYQTAVELSSDINGRINVSSDYGNTWTVKNPKYGWSNWRGVSISSTGEYQTVVSSGTQKIYVSYAAILNPPMPFYLSQLDVSVNSLSASLLTQSSSVFSGDATVAVEILLENAMNIFQFQSDSTDIDNVTANDIKYRVVYTGDSSYNMVFNIDTSSNVIVNSIYSGAANNNATYDYVRYLAQQLFNTHLGVDLFSNESDLRQDLMDAFSTSFTSNMTRLHAVETDASGNSPSKTILNEIINNHPERLNDISSLAVGNNWFKCPLVVGDILYFCLTVKAAANQNTITNVVAIPDRVYLIKVTLIS